MQRTRNMLKKIGYKLMAEEHGPAALVRNAVRAEQAGFNFAAISDHFSPWLDEQGHSPFAWSVLGAAANATSRIGLMTAVTCPIMRYHPAMRRPRYRRRPGTEPGSEAYGLNNSNPFNPAFNATPSQARCRRSARQKAAD